MSQGQIIVSVISAVGEGAQRREEVEIGTTLETLVRFVSGKGLEARNVRVNGIVTDNGGYVLQDGDRITIAPDKVEGA